MTRILVCGVVDDAVFVHNKLTEVNKIYGPITCVIHANHVHALAWQQATSRGMQPVKHYPVTDGWQRDGGQKFRDYLFGARPEYVVVFPTPGPGGRDKRVEMIVHRALREGLIVLTYETEPLCRSRGRPATTRLDVLAA